MSENGGNGKGELTLYRVTYNDKSEPVEKAVQTWKLETKEFSVGKALDRRAFAIPVNATPGTTP